MTLDFGDLMMRWMLFVEL